MKYRKKPVVVEAVQWTGENEDEIKKFCGLAAQFTYMPTKGEAFIVTKQKPKGKHVTALSIRTLEGTMEAEFYPCKPDIFRKTYEEVKDE